MNVKDKKEELQEKIREYQAELQSVESIEDDIPDLETGYDRWSHEYYTAKSVNTRVTNALFKHSCGCCDDAPLRMWPYVILEGKQIYSSPMYFTIGEQCPNCFENIAYSGWEEELHKAGIPESVIDIGRNYFKENGCDGHCYDDDED
jgi:hypothetical protein